MKYLQLILFFAVLQVHADDGVNAGQSLVNVVVPGKPGVGYGFRLTKDNLYFREMDPKELPIDFPSQGLSHRL